MNARALKIVGGVAALLLVAAGAAGYWVVKSKRDAYVRESMEFVTKAQQDLQEGRFEDAVATASIALGRRNEHPTWFTPEEAQTLTLDEAFYAHQLELWKKAQTAAGGMTADPAKARAELDALGQESAKGGGRAEPVTQRIRSLQLEALGKERDKVVASVTQQIPEARKAYEQGSWDDLLTRLDGIKSSIASLPDPMREDAAKRFETDLKAVEAIAAPVATMRSIRDGKDDGFVKADRLRDLIDTLTDLKGRDSSLHRDLRKAIADLEAESRKPITGIKLRKDKHRQLAENFAKGTDLERIGNPDDTSVIEFQGPQHRYAIRVAGAPPQFVVEVDRVRLNVSFPLISNRERLTLEAATKLSKALRATRHPRVFADEPWTIAGDAPGLCAFQIKDKQALVYMDGRLFEGTVAADLGNGPAEAFIKAAKDLEAGIRQSTTIPEAIKGPVAALVGASHTRAPPGDFLEGQYCREALQNGYLEAHLPKMDDKIAALLKEYRRAYGDITKLRTRLEGKAADGATLALLSNLEDNSVWRIIDEAAKTTTFSSLPRDGMGASIAAVSVFSGTHARFPKDAEPVEVRMTHGLAGTISRWTAASGKLEFDPATWDRALTLGEIPDHFQTGEWQVPPHALKVDERDQARELILPGGSLAIAGLDALTPAPARREADEKFLSACAAVLRSPGEYHLFYRYFVQYVLDSPVTTATTLIGSSKHCGDAHQDAFQTLDRRLNGKFLADCDDLAELYWTILRRQNRPAFVLGVPGHATCGVAEKHGDEWTFFCVDTGPARQLQGKDLDDIVEKVLRSYDRDGSMHHDPRQMRFLFRFGGEQTRTDYFLDSRILRDPEYADLMIRVQEYWHFGFYALGIETMSKVLETDRMPANCQEIAGLYTRVGLWAEALKWTQAGIDGLEAKDKYTGLSDTLRVVQCLKEMKRKDEAGAALKKLAADIAGVLKSDPGQADRYRTLLFGVAANLAENDLPWEGWELIRKEVVVLFRTGQVAESLMAMVANIYKGMNDAVRAGATMTEAQKAEHGKIGEILKAYFAQGCFESDDSNTDVSRKYGQYFGFQVALLGLEKATAELLKPGLPEDRVRPDPSKKPEEALSWPWIRLSPVAYLVAAGSALEKEEAGAGGPKVAVEVIKALQAALPEIRKQGSLGTLEFQVLDLELLRACLEVDEKGIRAVFDEMKRQGWGALYESLSSTLGRAAEFMKLADFEKVFRIYCEYGVPRRHFYGVVYAASAAEARSHALAASRICIEKFPNDADMRREHALLEKLSK